MCMNVGISTENDGCEEYLKLCTFEHVGCEQSCGKTVDNYWSLTIHF